MFRRTLIAGLFLTVSLSGFAQQQLPNLRIRTRSVAELQADERSLIGQWCRLDYEGSRLTEDGWKKFDTLTNIKQNPEFSSIYVVSRYQMNPPERASMDGVVSYNVIGRYEMGIGYTKLSNTRDIAFRFSDKQGDLQIVELEPVQPNVSKPVFIDWIKQQLATTKNVNDKMALQNALDQLVPPPPKPKAEQGESSSKQPK
jgi:hypothetical protein